MVNTNIVYNNFANEYKVDEFLNNAKKRYIDEATYANKLKE